MASSTASSCVPALVSSACPESSARAYSTASRATALYRTSPATDATEAATADSMDSSPGNMIARIPPGVC